MFCRETLRKRCAMGTKMCISCIERDVYSAENKKPARGRRDRGAGTLFHTRETRIDNTAALRGEIGGGGGGRFIESEW